MNNLAKFSDCQNRRERRAIARRNYVQATYHAADHTLRFGKRAWAIVNTERQAINLGSNSSGAPAA